MTGRNTLRHVVLGVALLAGGCGKIAKTSSTSTESLGLEVLLEVDAMATLFSARSVLYAVVIIGVTLLVRRLLDATIRVVWRLGWDTEHAMARGQSVLDFTFAVVATLLILRPFFVAAPLVAGVLASGSAIIIAIALPTWVQDFAAGLELSTRQTVREGDQIELKRHSGTIRSIGILRTRLRTGDGSTVTVPNRLLAAATVRVGRDSGAVPIVVRLPPEHAEDPHYRERIERLALMSPYRRAGSMPTVRRTAEGWILTLQSWSTRDGVAPQKAIEKTIRELDARREATPLLTPERDGDALHG